MPITTTVQSQIKEQLDSLGRHLLQQVKSCQIGVADWGMTSLYLRLVSDLVRQKDFLHEARLLRDFASLSLEDGVFNSAALYGPQLLNLAALSAWEELGEGTPRRHLKKILTAIDSSAAQKQNPRYELLFGSTSLGLVAQLYNRQIARQRILKNLEAGIKQIDGYWAYPIPQQDRKRRGKTIRFDLGISHGLLAPAMFLNENLRKKSAARLFETLHQISLSEPIMPSTWPTAPGPQQSAWCYGDPMTGLALLRQDVVEVNSDHASNLILRSLNSKSWQALEADQHFCHGTSGLALIALRAEQLTRDRRFRTARTQLLQRATEPITKWITPYNLNLQKGSGALLMGHLGAGLSYATILRNGDSMWDRALLIAPLRRSK